MWSIEPIPDASPVQRGVAALRGGSWTRSTVTAAAALPLAMVFASSFGASEVGVVVVAAGWAFAVCGLAPVPLGVVLARLLVPTLPARVLVETWARGLFAGCLVLAACAPIVAAQRVVGLDWYGLFVVPSLVLGALALIGTLREVALRRPAAAPLFAAMVVVAVVCVPAAIAGIVDMRPFGYVPPLYGCGI